MVLPTETIIVTRKPSKNLPQGFEIWIGLGVGGKYLDLRHEPFWSFVIDKAVSEGKFFQILFFLM